MGYASVGAGEAEVAGAMAGLAALKGRRFGDKRWWRACDCDKTRRYYTSVGTSRLSRGLAVGVGVGAALQGSFRRYSG